MSNIGRAEEILIEEFIFYNLFGRGMSSHYSYSKLLIGNDLFRRCHELKFVMLSSLMYEYISHFRVFWNESVIHVGRFSILPLVFLEITKLKEWKGVMNTIRLTSSLDSAVVYLIINAVVDQT